MNYFDIFYALSDAALTAGYALYIFSAFSIRKRNKYVMAGITLLALLVLFSKLANISTKYSVIVSIIGIIMLSFVYCIKWHNRVFFTCLAYSLTVLCDNLAVILILRNYDVNIVNTPTPEATYMCLVWSRVMLFVFAAVIRILKEKMFDTIPYVRFWIVLIAPLSATLSIFLQLRMYMLSIWAYSDVFFIAWVTNGFFIMSAIIIFNVIDKLKKSAEYEARLALIDKLVTQQETRYRELENHGKSILKIKHDQKNFLIGVLSDLKAGNYKDIENCVARELATVDKADFPMDRSDSVIYLLINSKNEFAKECGIRFEAELHDIKELKTSSIDFAVLLGNALDNAIEAAKKTKFEANRYVSLMIKVDEGQIVVILKNYAPPDTDINDLRTGKKASGHGFGILSMKNIVDQYDGELFFDIEGSVFTTYITLNNKSLSA